MELRRSRTYAGLSIAVILLSVFAGMADAVGRSSDSYIIERDVLTGGGAAGSSTNYMLFGSIGQSSAIGPSSSVSYDNYAGFWHAAYCLKGDANSSRSVNVLDAILALRMLLELEILPGNLCAVDMDNSGIVDVSDVVKILRLSLGITP